MENIFIHPEAQIGKNVVIEPFSYIDKNVVIGDGTRIGPNVTIYSGARIGKNCQIFPGAVISAVPQDLKFVGEETLTIIGDNNILRECVTVHRGTASKGKTEIGNNCLIMAYCHVAHDCLLHNNIIMSNATQLAGEVEVDDFAIIGGGSLVHQFTIIGCLSMLQGGSKVNKDVPPYVIAAHEPLSYFGLNTVGLRRRGFSTETIQNLQEMYRKIFLSGLNNKDAVAQVLELFPESVERNNVVNFIKNSERGIIKGR